MQIEPTAIALTRLANQCVSTKGPPHPADVVHLMGAVQGLWKRTVKSGHVVMEARYFGKPARIVQKEFAKAAELIGQFYERKVVNRFRG